METISQPVSSDQIPSPHQAKPWYNVAKGNSLKTKALPASASGCLGDVDGLTGMDLKLERSVL